MQPPVTIKEYEEKDINNCNLDKLQLYLKCRKLETALKVTRHGVKAMSWVGVIKFQNMCFQILPKLICDDDKTDVNVIKNLIFMLSFTKKLDIKTSDNAKLYAEKNPFIEVLIREYAESLFEALKRLTPKRYTLREDNLKFLRGKIKFSENQRFNCVNKSRFYCEFDEFSENNILNELFLYVSTCLYNITNNSHTKKILKFVINYYSDIDFKRFDKFKTAKIHLTRSQELFKKSFTLAKIFIEQSSVDLSKNRFENITLLWDMNRLFEEFVFEIMNRNKKEFGCTFSAQLGRFLLIGDNSKKRLTKVDIMVKKSGRQTIIDTKYKKLTDNTSFANTDIFQVYTYCKLHGSEHAILLYPQWGDTRPEIPSYYLNTIDDKKCVIEFKTINLKYTDLKKQINNIKQELLEILKNV